MNWRIPPGCQCRHCRDKTPWPILLVIGAALAGCILLHGCATLTQPPKSWPPQPSCAADPAGPTCPPPIHDERPAK